MNKQSYGMKALLSQPFRAWVAMTTKLGEAMRRLRAHALLAHATQAKLQQSVVVLGPVFVDGTGAIAVGERCYLYPDLHLETRDEAWIVIENDVVMSRGVHVVAMAGVTIGAGSMIGEYSSIRDANHVRAESVPLRDAGHVAKPIVIGREVWIGRGVAVLGGVTIGDGATVGANAVVTRDVPANTVVAGVPAKAIHQSISD